MQQLLDEVKNMDEFLALLRNPLCYLKQALKQEARDVSVLGEETETV